MCQCIISPSGWCVCACTCIHMLVNYKCSHAESFGPSNLSVILWLFHSTRMSAEVINTEMWTGTLKHEWLKEQALNTTIQALIFLQRGHNYRGRVFFLILLLSLSSFKRSPCHLKHIKSNVEPLHFLSVLLTDKQHRWTHLCHNLTHWRHLLIAVSAVVSPLFHLVLHAAYWYF